MRSLRAKIARNCIFLQGTTQANFGIIAKGHGTQCLKLYSEQQQPELSEAVGVRPWLSCVSAWPLYEQLKLVNYAHQEKSIRTIKIRLIFIRVKAYRFFLLPRLLVFLLNHKLGVYFLGVIFGSHDLRPLLDFELGDIETIHVMDMRIESSRHAHGRVESLTPKLGVPFPAKFKPCVDKLYVRAF